MKCDNIWFGGKEDFKEYVDLIEKEKVNIGNIENVLKDFIITIDCSEASLIEFLYLKEAASEIEIKKTRIGFKDVNLESFNFTEDYINALQRGENILKGIEKETKLDLSPYQSFSLVEYDIQVVFKGYNIFQFFGSNITKIFTNIKMEGNEEVNEEDKAETNIFFLFYQSLNVGILNFLDYTTLAEESKKENIIIHNFINSMSYDKISKTETIKLFKLKDKNGIYFHFIDSKDDIKELKKMMKEGIKKDKKVSFLMNTSLHTYLFLLDYVSDHQSYNLLINNIDYILSNKLDEYSERISQVFKDLHTHRVYDLKDKTVNPIQKAKYLTGNLFIKYQIELSLEDLDIFDKLVEKENDIFDEWDKIKNQIEIVRKTLESMM